MLQVRFPSYCNKGKLPKNSKTSNRQNGKAIRSIFNMVSSLLLEKLSFTETATNIQVSCEIIVNYGAIQKVYML